MKRTTGPSVETRAGVYERDGWRCVRCARMGVGLTIQHRKARGMGGSTDPAKNMPASLLSLCGSGTTRCHGWVEAHPAAAADLGYRVAQHEDPRRVPVKYSDGWHLLDDDYQRIPCDAPDFTQEQPA